MPVIRLLIAQGNRKGAPAGSFAEFSPAFPDFRVVSGQVVSPRDVEAFMDAQPIEVVILVGDEPELDELGRKLLARYPRIIILRLTVIPPSLSITPAISDFGVGDLASTLRSLVRSSPAFPRRRLVHKQMTTAELASLGREQESECFRTVRAWITALLKAKVFQEKRKDGDGLAGLTIAQETAIQSSRPGSCRDRRRSRGRRPLGGGRGRVPARGRQLAVGDRLRAVRADAEFERKTLLLCLAPELDTVISARARLPA